MADRHLFGTDGVRGVANDGLTPEIAFDLARAAGEGREGHVLVGRDTRRSGPMLAAALMAGFNSVGVDTVDLGIIPVGAVSRLVRDSGATYGAMVSASHNPAPDNGIKFFGRNGTKLSDDSENEEAIEYAHKRVNERCCLILNRWRAGRRGSRGGSRTAFRGAHGPIARYWL